MGIKGDKTPKNNWLKEGNPPSFNSLITKIGYSFLSKSSAHLVIVSTYLSLSSGAKEEI